MSTKASELPGGSIVATWGSVYMKRRPGEPRPWESFDSNLTDQYIDSLIAQGAEVLRVGRGVA